MKFFKKLNKKNEKTITSSREAAKERLHLVLMQDRANVSADFLELMKQEIIEVIKKYIDVDEAAIDVRLTNKENEDGTNGAPALYANIPILNIKNEAKKVEKPKDKQEEKADEKVEKKEEKEEGQKEESKKESKKEKAESVLDKKEEKKSKPVKEENTIEDTKEELKSENEEEKE